MSPRSFRGLVLAALLVALGLRLWGVDHATLTQWDEGPYAGAAMHKGPAVREDPRIVYAPPLFPAMCGALYKIFGEDVRLAIGLAGVLGALSVVAVALLARLLFGALAGVFAAWMLAVEPLSVAHARLALTESLFTLLTLVAIHFAIRTLRSGATQDALLLGVVAGLATLTKFHGFLPLAIFAVVGAVGGAVATPRGPDRKMRLVHHLRAVLIAGAVAAPFAVFVLRDILDVMTLAEFSKSRETWVEGLHGYTITSTAVFAIDVIRELGAFGLTLLGAVGALLSLRRARDPALWMVLGYAAILALTLVTYMNYARLFVPAFALLTLFGGHALATLAGATVSSTGERWRTRAAWVVAGLAAVTGYYPLHAAVTYRGGGYPEMAARLTAQLDKAPGPTVAVAQQALFPYLPVRACDRVWWITESTGQTLVKDASFRYLVTDLDFDRHWVKPLARGFADRLELIAEVPNPMPRAVLFDRLRPEELRKFDRYPTDPQFANATRLRLFALRMR